MCGAQAMPCEGAMHVVLGAMSHGKGAERPTSHAANMGSRRRESSGEGAKLRACPGGSDAFRVGHGGSRWRHRLPCRLLPATLVPPRVCHARRGLRLRTSRAGADGGDGELPAVRARVELAGKAAAHAACGRRQVVLVALLTLPAAIRKSKRQVVALGAVDERARHAERLEEL